MGDRSSRRAARRDTPAHAHRILDRAYDLLNDVEALIEAAAGGPVDLTVLQAQMAATRAGLTAAVNSAAAEDLDIVSVTAGADTVRIGGEPRRSNAAQLRRTRPPACGYRADANDDPCTEPAVAGACANHLDWANADQVLHEVAAIVQRELDVNAAVARHVDDIYDIDIHDIDPG